MKPEYKLYIVTHSDLPTGYQVPQTTHAAMEFAALYPEEWREWYRTSNSVIVLNTQNELKLHEFAEKLKKNGVKFAEFREPDIGNELTAIAICPGPTVKKLCSDLPLAGKRVNPGAQERLQRKFEIIEAMESTLQTEGQNMIQHGESVRDHLFDLINFLRDPRYRPKYQWRYPQWLLHNAQNLLEKLPPDHILEKYAFWHDCGKPLCKIVDSEGKTHFPGHAKESAKIFRELYPEWEQSARLIEQDMDIHTLPAEEIEEFAKRPEAVALLLSGLAAIHSNAEMFGGLMSDSFKAKWKHLDRRGKAICKVILGG